MANSNALDKYFSLWVRLSNSDENGYGKCCTCGKFIHYKNAQCGHFISRRHLATRWSEQNTGFQCVACNVFNQGRQFEFSQYINNRYGKGTADKMLVLSRATCKIGKFEIDTLAGFYKKEVEKLKQEKGL